MRTCSASGAITIPRRGSGCANRWTRSARAASKSCGRGLRTASAWPASPPSPLRRGRLRQLPGDVEGGTRRACGPADARSTGNHVHVRPSAPRQRRPRGVGPARGRAGIEADAVHALVWRPLPVQRRLRRLLLRAGRLKRLPAGQTLRLRGQMPREHHPVLVRCVCRRRGRRQRDDHRDPNGRARYRGDGRLFDAIEGDVGIEGQSKSDGAVARTKRELAQVIAFVHVRA